MARLRRSDPLSPGIRRRRRGRGFGYHWPDGSRVADPDVLARIRALVIPPAWTDVWITPWANGHIQAMGTDARGRRQYRYHDAWTQRRDAEKFEHMVAFAAALGPLRRVVSGHVAGTGLGHDRVLACAVRLLDLGFFRIGTEGYVEDNNTFGLATMRRRHVRVEGRVVTFDYPSKSGKQRLQSVVDDDVAAVVGSLKARHGGGRELLAYDDGGGWVDVRSTDINDYLKAHTDAAITAKDFRTWHATVACAVGLACGPPAAASATAGRRAVAATIRDVASYLGNTPAVCRRSYVDPRVIDRYLGGTTIQQSLDRIDAADPSLLGERDRHSVEQAVLALLTETAGDLADVA